MIMSRLVFALIAVSTLAACDGCDEGDAPSIAKPGMSAPSMDGPEADPDEAPESDEDKIEAEEAEAEAQPTLDAEPEGEE